MSGWTSDFVPVNFEYLEESPSGLITSIGVKFCFSKSALSELYDFTTVFLEACVSAETFERLHDGLQHFVVHI